MPLLGPNGTPIAPTPEQLAAPPDETLPAEPVACVTAFTVYQLPTGEWQVADDLNVPLVPGRKPGGDDFTAGCSVVLRDVATHAAANLIIPNTAQAVVNAQMQIGRQVAEAQQSAKVAQKLEAEKRARAGRR
jgi:hypothetical protein